MARTVRRFVPLIAAAVIAVGVAGCSDDTTSGGTPPATTSPSDPVTGGALLPAADQQRLCQSELGATGANGATQVDHTAWGPTTVIACGPTAGSGPDEQAGVLVVDRSGEVRWVQPFTAGYYEFAMADPGVDASGNVFITYNPGRLDGVIILRPTPTGFEVLAGFGTDGSPTTTLDFYSAALQGPGSTGLYEVEVTSDDCEPDCASGTKDTQVFTWDGTTYVTK